MVANETLLVAKWLLWVPGSHCGVSLSFLWDVYNRVTVMMRKIRLRAGTDLEMEESGYIKGLDEPACSRYCQKVKISIKCDPHKLDSDPGMVSDHQCIATRPNDRI